VSRLAARHKRVPVNGSTHRLIHRMHSSESFARWDCWSPWKALRNTESVFSQTGTNTLLLVSVTRMPPKKGKAQGGGKGGKGAKGGKQDKEPVRSV
jgi:hypothetical protein